MLKSKVLLSLLILSFININAHFVYQDVGASYLKSLNGSSDSVRTDNEKQVPQIFTKFDAPVFTDHIKRKIALDIFSLIEGEKNIVIKDSIWKDLELFYGKGENPDKSLLSKIDRTETIFGQLYLGKILANPRVSISELKGRQEFVRELVSNNGLYGEFAEKVQKIKESEESVISFWSGQTKTSLFENNLYFTDRWPFHKWPLNRLNKSPKILGAVNRAQEIPVLPSPGLVLYNIYKNYKEADDFSWSIEDIGNMSGGAVKDAMTYKRIRDYVQQTWDMPYNFEKWMRFAKVSLGTAAFSGLMVLLYEFKKASIESVKYLQTRLIQLAQYLETVKELEILIASNQRLSNKLSCQKNISDLFDKVKAKSKDLEQLLSLLSKNTFKGKASFFSMLGRILAANKIVLEIKDELIPVIEAAAEIDAHVSIATLYREFSNKQVTYTFPGYVDNDKPYICLNGLWNPFVNREEVVINNIELGSKANNAVVTGPNAGGKSTVLKGIAINLLLAQTLGIAPSQSLVLTPFSKINSYIDISDDISTGKSLFKAEVLQAKSLIKLVSGLKHKEFSFSIMDEIFSSTSPKEGEVASYMLSKTLGKYINSMLLVATHFPKMTDLEQDAGTFRNYKVTVAKNSDGTLVYPYKLESGKSDQNIAFDILANDGVMTAENLTEAYGLLGAH